MLNLYTISTKKESSETKLTSGEKISIYYHNIFDFPLNIHDLVKWRANDSLEYTDINSFVQKSGYFYLEGNEGLVYKRLLRERISAKKNALAKRAAKIISLVPTVKLVAVTGSLAMQNSSAESDIDLMIITENGTLWITRLITYGLLKVTGLGIRKPQDTNEKDRLCLNIWLDENNLSWKESERNIYTAHEIAQIKPLVNKDKIYERFLWKNKWLLDYWPYSVKIKKIKNNQKSSFLKVLVSPFEKFAYKFQLNHMNKRKTREVVTSGRALFHPQDWSKVVINRLSS